MKKIICFLGVLSGFLAACSSNKSEPVYIEAPVMSAYYSDWDRAVRADVDMQNMYAGTPSRVSKPIDMYMAMALALKYNYSRRLASYQESLIKSNIVPTNLSTMAANLGYTSSTASQAIPADLKASWNALDVSALYYQNGLGDPEISAEEQSRKVINNIMFEARTLYWKALAAQRLIPVIDDMNEYLMRIVDEINARSNEMAREGKSPSTGLLLRKRKYMESIKDLASIRHKFDNAQAEFSGLLGFYPSTEIKLAGSQYGNFAIPSLRAKMQQLEWLALTNRPELRAFDNGISKDELELVIQDFDNVDNDSYRQHANYYNQKWSRESNNLSMNLFEDIRYQGTSTYNSLARQRLTHIILNQVYLSWALYQSAVEDYYLNMGVANTSEDIAEDITNTEGSSKAISHLESARAVIDEANAFLSYVDVQEAIGRLYASVGLDAVPSYMLNESPSNIAVEIRETFDKWRKGIFYTVPKDASVMISGKKPPVDVSSRTLVPDVAIGTGSALRIQIPDEIFASVNWTGPYTTTAGSLDDFGLPRWLKYDAKSLTFTGTPSIGDEGSYRIKVFAYDDTGNSAVVSFTITVNNLYIQTMEYKGLNGYRRAKVYHKCTDGAPCPNNSDI